MDILLTSKALPNLPLSIDANDTEVSYGETWVNAPYNSTYNTARLRSLRSWWTNLYLNQNDSLIEKLHLFWHNHFSTEITVVNRPVYIFKYVKIMYEQATGSFRQLVKDITVTPTMLRYLDGVDNVAGSPNENYARELFELFTIGKGPLISEGNYSHYTENDIQEAARSLTGWKINANTAESFFNSSLHDKNQKVFSNYYSGHTLNNQEQNEYKSLIDMILSKEETARHIVRKLYRWFVYHEIDEVTEQVIITPLASIFYNSDYNVKLAVETLLSSEHFFSDKLSGAYIKNPLEHTLGTLRKTEVVFPANIFTSYEFWNLLHSQASLQELKIGDPPDVAGWAQWYLAPQYTKLWISSVSIPLKAEFTDRMVDSGHSRSGEKIIINPLIIANQLENPSDPNSLLTELCRLFLPLEPTEGLITYLKEVLIPGLPDSVWTHEWDTYKSNPGNTQQQNIILSPLKKVFKELMRMPDYNLI